MKQSLTVTAGDQIRLADFDPRFCEGIDDKATARAETAEHVAALDDLVYRLYAENQRSVLLVLQGMDTAGKDGAIRNLLHGVSPQSCQIASFKQPSQEELDHHFLWRINRATPSRGNLGIFNRSHYEDVGVVRVHKLISAKVCKARYKAINEFEELLTDGGMTIVKCYLHISKDEQRERLQARLDDPNKRWKFNRGDLEERKFWDDYQEAYQDALTACNTRHAPWHIVPADRKWYRDLVISRLLRATLEKLNPQYPASDPELEGIKVE